MNPTPPIMPTGHVDFSERLIVKFQDIALKAIDVLDPTPDLRVLLYPGSDVSWDENCEGMVWTRLVNILPAPPSSPSRKPGTHACAVPEFLVEGELGIIRCAATINDQAQFPSASQITRDGEQSLLDMGALLGVLRCTRRLRSVGNWTPQGPQGGYHGGYWRFSFRVGNCIDCEQVDD